MPQGFSEWATALSPGNSWEMQILNFNVSRYMLLACLFCWWGGGSVGRKWRQLYLNNDKQKFKEKREKKILSHPTPRPAKSESLGWGPAICVLTCPLGERMPTPVWEPLAYAKHSSLGDAVTDIKLYIKLPKTMQHVPTYGVVKSPREQSLWSLAAILRRSLQKTSKPRGAERLRPVHTMQVMWPLLTFSSSFLHHLEIKKRVSTSWTQDPPTTEQRAQK